MCATPVSYTHLDVYKRQLLALSNVVLTPHIASATRATRRAMADKAADNLLAFFAGQALPSPVNQPARSKN